MSVDLARAAAIEAAAKVHHERMRQDKQNIVSAWDDISESWRQETCEHFVPLFDAYDQALAEPSLSPSEFMQAEADSIDAAEPVISAGQEWCDHGEGTTRVRVLGARAGRRIHFERLTGGAEGKTARASVEQFLMAFRPVEEVRG